MSGELAINQVSVLPSFVEFEGEARRARGPIVYQCQDWPKDMQETTCQKVWRIAFAILSVIIFPIGLVRITRWCICKLIAQAILPAAYISNKAGDYVQSLSDEEFQQMDFLFSCVLNAFEDPLPSGQQFIPQLAQMGEEGALLSVVFDEVHESLRMFRRNPNKEEMRHVINQSVSSLHSLPDDLLSKFFLSQRVLTQGERVNPVFEERLRGFAAAFEQLLNQSCNRESQAIFRKVILGHPNNASVTMTTPDGVKLDGVHICQNDHPDAKTIVFCNPNAASYEDFYPLMRDQELREGYRDSSGQLYNYLFFNYRGVGTSEGSPDPEGLLIDGYTAVHTVEQQLGVPRNNIIVHGWSLGGAVGAYAAAQHQGSSVDGSDSVNVCNDRSFSSLLKEIEELGQKIVCWLLAKIAAIFTHLVGWNWDALAWWRQINGYKWVVVHPSDQIIPRQASLASAWGNAEGVEAVQDRIMELQDSPNGHMRLLEDQEKNLFQMHLQRTEGY